MATTKLMAAEDLMLVSDIDGRHELVRGELISLPFNSGIHGFIAGKLCWLLENYTDDHPEFRALAGGVGIIIERNPDTVRGADLLLVHGERVPPGDGPLPTAPDFLIEILSIWDEASYENGKILDYMRAGVQLLWCVDPHLEIVHVYTPDYCSRIYQRGETLDGAPTVPGLKLLVDAIFE